MYRVTQSATYNLSNKWCKLLQGVEELVEDNLAGKQTINEDKS